jgi:hypothetical protein
MDKHEHHVRLAGTIVAVTIRAMLRGHGTGILSRRALIEIGAVQDSTTDDQYRLAISMLYRQRIIVRNQSGAWHLRIDQ